MLLSSLGNVCTWDLSVNHPFRLDLAERVAADPGRLFVRDETFLSADAPREGPGMHHTAHILTEARSVERMQSLVERSDGGLRVEVERKVERPSVAGTGVDRTRPQIDDRDHPFHRSSRGQRERVPEHALPKYACRRRHAQSV